ncbi:transcriptional Coactivator p15-domain-containing protein [Cladochytrium replicatum]|nr:transcriptional Coactivator p15-domain-containing protein [Cladochytrium replicatum]
MSRRLKSRSQKVVDEKESDDEVEEMDDSESKSGKNSSSKAESSKSDDFEIELGKFKKLTVSSFKGQKRVDLRTYYTDKKSGELRPTQKGISLSVEEWKVLKSQLANVDAKLEE